VFQLGMESGLERGWKARAAKQLGVDRGTISRDFRAAMVRVLAQEWLQSLGPNLRSQLQKWTEELRKSVPETCDRGEGRIDQPTDELSRALDVIDRVDTLVGQGSLTLADVPSRWEEITDLAATVDILATDRKPSLAQILG
jgi:hypothetical protein